MFCRTIYKSSLHFQHLQIVTFLQARIMQCLGCTLLTSVLFVHYLWFASYLLFPWQEPIKVELLDTSWQAVCKFSWVVEAALQVNCYHYDTLNEWAHLLHGLTCKRNIDIEWHGMISNRWSPMMVQFTKHSFMLGPPYYCIPKVSRRCSRFIFIWQGVYLL